MNTRSSFAAVATAVAMTSTLLVAGPAVANEDDVILEGSCSASTHWKLKASPEDYGIEVEAEVDSNRNRQKWRWRLVHNDDLMYADRGRAVTRGPSGSFEVRRVMADLAGTDKIRFRAGNPRTGEVCRGTVYF